MRNGLQNMENFLGGLDMPIPLYTLRVEHARSLKRPMNRHLCTKEYVEVLVRLGPETNVLPLSLLSLGWPCVGS